MQSKWRSLLAAAGLKWDERGYGFNPAIPAEPQEDYICDLSHLKFVRAQGPDAVDFLHAQLTNDLKQLAPTASQLSGYCTPKGRLLCVFRIHRERDDLLLQAHHETLSASVDRLRRYILRAKIELDIDEETVSFGVVGERSSKTLSDLVGPLPEQDKGCLVGDNWTILCHSTSAPRRFQLIGSPAALSPLWQSMSRNCSLMGSRAWAGVDIRQGLPTIFISTSEEFVPQMVNMDLIGGVNFHKGCFPGQEIVARMHYLGKLKTRMILCHIDAEAMPLPGDKLYAANREQSTGMVVDATPAAGGGYDMLATARLEQLDKGDLRFAGGDGARVQIKDLPYPLENPEQRQT